MKWFLVCAAAAAASVLPGSQTVDEYKLDPGHTYIGFAVKHFGLTTVRGNFKRFSGTIRYDSTAVEKSSVDILIAAASLTTGNGERDDALMGPHFLDVKKFPSIGFKSTGVVSRGGQLVVAGQLTIHGTTHVVELPLDFVAPVKAPQNDGKLTLGAEGQLTINRKLYGVSFHQVMDNGALFVGDDVRIEITAEAINTGRTFKEGE